jgi:hypothetical protein
MKIKEKLTFGMSLVLLISTAITWMTMPAIVRPAYACEQNDQCALAWDYCCSGRAWPACLYLYQICVPQCPGGGCTVLPPS